MTEEAVATIKPEELGTGTPVSGEVIYLAPYGVMINIAPEVNAFLHISKMQTKDFRNIEDVYTVGDTVEAYVLKVDGANRIALDMEKPPELPWSKIRRGETYNGSVIRIESYGAFIDIGAERPGMVHVSELADGYVQSPEDIVKVGEEVEVRVIKLNKKNRQIDLSMRTPEEEIQQALEPDEDVPSAMELAFRRAQRQAEATAKPAGGNKKTRKRRSRSQDDIISRTLRNQEDY
ncbi:MAG: S1 RNA-binding domain-containing protein [Chloroflexota bacterium]